MAKIAVKKIKSEVKEVSRFNGDLPKLKDGNIQKKKKMGKKPEVTAAALDAVKDSLAAVKMNGNTSTFTVKKTSKSKKSLNGEVKKVSKVEKPVVKQSNIQKLKMKGSAKKDIVKSEKSLDQSENGAEEASVKPAKKAKKDRLSIDSKVIPNGNSSNGQIKQKDKAGKLGRFDKLKVIEEARKKKQLKQKIPNRTAVGNGDLKISLDDLQPDLNGTVDSLPKLSKKLAKKGKGGKKAFVPVERDDSDTDSDDADAKEDDAMCKAYKDDFGFDEVVDKVIEEKNKEEDMEEEKKLKEVDNKKKRIERGPEELMRTVEVTNVNLKTIKKTLLNLFKRFGKVESVRYRNFPVKDVDDYKLKQIRKNCTIKKRSSMTAFVKFAAAESAKSALQANTEVVDAHHLFVKSSMYKTPQEHRKDLARGCTILVGNLPYYAEEEMLYKHFEACGRIVNISVIRKDHKATGTAFLEFETKEAVSSSFKLNNTKLQNRFIRVEKAVRKVKGANKAQPGPKPLKKKGGYGGKPPLKGKKAKVQGGASTVVAANSSSSQPSKKTVHSRLSRPDQAQTTAKPGNFTGNKFDQPLTGAAQRLKNKKTKEEIKKIVLAKKLASKKPKPVSK